MFRGQHCSALAARCALEVLSKCHPVGTRFNVCESKRRNGADSPCQHTALVRDVVDKEAQGPRSVSSPAIQVRLGITGKRLPLRSRYGPERTHSIADIADQRAGELRGGAPEMKVALRGSV